MLPTAVFRVSLQKYYAGPQCRPDPQVLQPWSSDLLGLLFPQIGHPQEVLN